MWKVELRCGFQTINYENDFFRRKAISKGQQLVESHHVFEVRELQGDLEFKVSGKVIPETNVTKHAYEVHLELDHDRNLQATNCNCKAGKGRCKHSAALCIFVNQETTKSKTDEPLVWNRPSARQLQKYKKGATIESMFPRKQPLGFDLFRLNTFQDVINVTEEHLQINSIFGQIIKAERECSIESEYHAMEKIREKEEKKNIVGELFKHQSGKDIRFYHAYEGIAEGSKVALKRLICPHEYQEVYDRNVVVDKQSGIAICCQSTGQSSSAVWFQERYVRITCSEKAHKIKTRQKNFEELAKQFYNDKFHGMLTVSMEYGLRMEPIARSFFEGFTSFKVEQVGLVISLAQPFLACSPDGGILNAAEPALLEIKCPASCEFSKLIVDGVGNVPYLKVNDAGEAHLHEGHKYFTQIQVSMYILQLKLCYFFVYTKVDKIILEIRRDETFLSLVIPKIESFYFQYFLPLLM